MDRLEKQLVDFSNKEEIVGKGPLSLVLVLTRSAQSRKPPFRQEDFLAPRGGQVAGLGKAAVQAILSDHGIERVLAEEGGRTSRGSISRMQAYISFLNKLNREKLLDFPRIEAWWIEKVKAFFASMPLRLKMDTSKSLRRIVGELIEAAFQRQRECPGTMVAGAVMQHLVGAKLQVALPDIVIEHKGAFVADSPSGRKGDFLLGDTAIHVTTAPTESLINKCHENLYDNLRPVIITSDNGAEGAKALAKNAGIEERVDILEIEQFIATNIYEWIGFKQENRPLSIKDLIDNYNIIIDECETDPSLKISLG